MADGSSKITSADVRDALKLRYPALSHALLFEVANGTGGNGRVFADAVAFGLWPSHGHAVEGVEIKVSRSDFLSEMKRPDKSGPVFRYCDRWWLACPKGMVEPGELPATWGLLELCGETLRTRVKAPKLEPETMPRTFVASLLRRHAGADEDMARINLKRELAKGEAEYRARIDREAQMRASRAVADAERANEAWQAVLDATGVDFRRMHDQAGFCQAVSLVQELGTGWPAALQCMRDNAAKVVTTVDQSGLLRRPKAAAEEEGTTA